MNRKLIFCMILLFLTASLDISIARSLELKYGSLSEKSQLADEAQAQDIVRAFQLPAEDYAGTEGCERADVQRLLLADHKDCSKDLILAYLFCQDTDAAVLKKWCRTEKNAQPARYEKDLEIVENLLADAVYFPVPEAFDDDAAGVSFENSWQYERTYGGSRGHEGCDIMADVQQRGYYPVISCSEGVVEKMGWLEQGGYRIGIRSPRGVYYYYAHLAEYEEGMEEGKAVAAGQLLGYMGDTGYSSVEGTTGNFPVHLHFGMYLNDEEGGEISYNPYFLLKLLENNKLKYVYRQ